MVELTRQEKIIVVMMYTLLNPKLENSSFQDRHKAIYKMLELVDIRTDELELVDLVNSANSVILHGKSKALSILDKLGVKGLRYR